MAPSQKNDFSVQVIGLDVVRFPEQTLPGRSALSGLAVNDTEAKDVPPAGLVFGLRNEVNAGSVQTGDAFLTSQSRDWTRTRRYSAKCFNGVAKIHQKLPVFPSHDVGAHYRMERRSGKSRGNRVGRFVDSRWISTDVKQAGHRIAPCLNNSRHEISGRTHDANAVNAFEPSQRQSLVFNSILSA